MLRIERILCPASVPPESSEALRYAVSLARAYCADLILCHCTQDPRLIISQRLAVSRDAITQALADLLSRYSDPADHIGPSHHEVLVVPKGRGIGEGIVRTACEQSADLIVMRWRGPGVGVLGPNVEQVSRTASCPVLVLHHTGARTADPKTPVKFARILASHDFSGSSELALSYALSIAQKYQAELHLLHVLPEPGRDDNGNHSATEHAYRRVAQRLGNYVSDDLYARGRITCVLRWGRPYREVLAYAKEHEIDLICMGALGGDFGRQALFGSNVDRVLRQANCPVLIGRPLRPATSANVDYLPGRIAFGKALIGPFMTLLPWVVANESICG